MYDVGGAGFLATWSDILVQSLEILWTAFVGFLPRIIGALVVLIVGWLIAASLGMLVARIIRAIKLDELVEKLDLKKSAKRAGIDLSISGLVGWIVKWFLILTFFISAIDILGWSEVNDFLRDVVLYLPNVAVAVLILLAGFVLGKFIHDVVDGAVRTAKVNGADFFAGIAKWAIFVFAGAAALVQLGIAASVVEILLTGLVAMLSIAGGLAFGLGGRDAAGRFIERVRKDISE